MGEWQDISTAPRDGTRIVVYREGYAESMCIALWARDWDDWLTVPGGWQWRPEWWQPLPPPPNTGKGEGV